MHDIRAIRENPAAFDAALALRNLPPASPEILSLDADRRSRIASAEAAQAEQNKASKEAGAAKARGDEAEFARLRALVSAKKDETAFLQAEATALDAKLRDLLLGIPNLPLDRGEVALPVRVPERDANPNTEVGQMGSALNRMLDHISTALSTRQASETRVRQFVADASHELRTPLAAIRGYAELAQRRRTEVPDEVAHAMGRVSSEADRMTHLVEDLLLLARLDSGRPLERGQVDLSQLAVDALSDAHIAGPDHQWNLDLPDEPVLVDGDAARLHQVLTNLLTNARVHTPPDTTVTLALTADGRDAHLQVSDNGPGIPVGLQSEVFERFARGDSSRSRHSGSTGLGLAIVAAVVKAHDGQIAVRSVPGDTVFTVTLPLTAGA